MKFNFKFQILNFKLKKGYTLVELLIFMALFTILITIFTEIFATILDVRRESETTSSVVQDGNYLLNRLMYDIERASVINNPANDGDVSPPSPPLNLTIDGLTYDYNLVSNNLVLSVGSEALQLNSYSTAISNLTFTRIGNSDDEKDTIRFSFTVTSKAQKSGGPEVRNFQTTVGLR